MSAELSLFDPLEGDALGVGHERSALSRRLRVLLHLDPLFRLRAGDGRRDPELRHYDTLGIALRILDLIAAHMGLDQAATADTLFRGVRASLAAMDELAVVEPSPARHRKIFDKVLGALRNEDDGYRPFRLDWSDVDDAEQPVSRVLSFRLIEDTFGLDGAPVLRLSPTAINLVFSALEMDIEDAQTATEAIVQAQIRRGRFGHAVESARNALRQSLAFQRRVRRILQLTRRDIHRVDWSVEVPALLDDALAHLEERLSVESTIRESAHARLDHLQPGSEEARQVAEIAELVSRCIGHHTRLQRDLLEARAAFLDAQARQAFVPRRARIVRSLYADALLPLLELPATQVREIGERWLPDALGARVTPSFNLRDMVEGLLSPRQERRAAFVTEADHDAVEVAEEPRFFQEDDYAAVWAEIARVDDATRWSALLQGDALDDAQRQLLAIETLAWADPDGDAPRPLAWGAPTGERVRVGQLWVDDHHLAPVDARSAAPPEEDTP